MCLREGSRWKVSWSTAPLHKGKQVLQIRHTRQSPGRCKGRLFEAHCDHRRTRVVEQVWSEVRCSHEVG